MLEIAAVERDQVEHFLHGHLAIGVVAVEGVGGVEVSNALC
jgi:hypothetical protein